MSISMSMQLGIIAVIALLCFYEYHRTFRRSATEALVDLNSEQASPVNLVAGKEIRLGELRFSQSDPLTKLGLFIDSDRKKYRLKKRLTPIFFAATVLAFNICYGTHDLGRIIVPTIVAFSIGYLKAQSLDRKTRDQYIKSVEFALPIVMERLVMAVQAGHHILSAVRAIIELDTLIPLAGSSNQTRLPKDSVSHLLQVVYQLTHAGMKFEDSLKVVADTVDIPTLKHAFIYLALAHRDGGELVGPLKELSDSTQLYYQESIEEQIAKLPVKATLPLLCTFAGLIISFITTPLVQISSLSQEVAPDGGPPAP